MDKHKISVQVDLLAKVDQFSTTIANMQKQLSGLKLNKSISDSLEGSFSNIEKEMKKISEISQKGEVNIVDEREILSSFNKIERAWSSVLNKLKSTGANTALLEKDKKAIDAIIREQGKYTNEVKKTQKEQNKLQKALEGAKKKQSEFNDLQEEINTKRKKRDDAKREVNDRVKAKKGHKTADKTLASAEAAINSAVDRRKEILGGKSQTAYSAELTAEVNKATEDLRKFNEASKTSAASFKQLIVNLKNMPDINWEEMGIDLDQINNVEQLEDALEKLKTRAGEDGAKALETLKNSADMADTALEDMKKEIDGADRELEELIQRQKDFDDLRNKLLAFFSISNAARIFQRAVRNAYEAIKELDEVMTQTAVVTDFSVGDMWSQLPEYTDRANELGVAVKGVYEASTLYYQQGLKTEEVIEVSTETLKMAKIAGLDYAKATDYMTAALRGFNMEVNETNALRINDVYSELAAITAADTEEIASAMTKTASIASNANMEFETTAAFLSQIIETTRESAETAGTAMKTVIARFQELKKDPSEIGEVDGEIVDANKIEGALRTIGVALRDSSGQFRDLDDVFLELAKKWKTLDTNTQRYIATIAAGSRLNVNRLLLAA